MSDCKFVVRSAPTRLAFIAATIALSWLSLSSARAAPNDNCQMQISNTVIDYGQVTRAELLDRQVSPTAFALGKQTMTLSASRAAFAANQTSDTPDHANDEFASIEAPDDEKVRRILDSALDTTVERNGL